MRRKTFLNSGDIAAYGELLSDIAEVLQALIHRLSLVLL